MSARCVPNINLDRNESGTRGLGGPRSEETHLRLNLNSDFEPLVFADNRPGLR